MTDQEIITLWRQHQEVLGFTRAVIERVKQPPGPPVAYIATNAVGWRFLRIHRPDSVYNPIPLYDLREKK